MTHAAHYQFTACYVSFSNSQIWIGGFLLKNYRKSKAVNKINNNLNAQNYDKKSKGMTGIIVIN